MSAQNISLGRCVLAGLIAGIVGALLANLALVVLTKHFGQSFEQLTWFSITRSSMISSVLGGFVYYALGRWTERPVLWFIVAGISGGAPGFVFCLFGSPEAG